MAMILLSLALVSAGDEPTRAKMVRSMGRFSQLRVTEGTGTLAGTYQRGRLEGFLTAHPGCHLSGIIRALEMGNHQAVHHLRILENEGNVWCRRDGRLLRYYTSAVDRAAETSNLPRPVDASQLSDVALMVLRSIAEQEDGETPPTQRELASTIGTSQQLVGHHLKRLESQGLITRRRRGLRTNRELTDEGMRLWATLVEPLSLRP
jgi:DNA-binding MarR family transcriptional regulator